MLAVSARTQLAIGIPHQGSQTTAGVPVLQSELFESQANSLTRQHVFHPRMRTILRHEVP